MRRGDWVRVYEDPVTRLCEEGTAEVVGMPGAGAGGTTKVRFGRDEAPVWRRIKTEDVVRHLKNVRE